MEAVWRETRNLRSTNFRLTSALSASLSDIALRRVSQITSGQLQVIGPDCSVTSVYAISVESKFVGSDIHGPRENHPESIGLIKQIIIDHHGDILDSSPSRIVACWIPSEQVKHTFVARLTIQAASKILTAFGEEVVACICDGELNHAFAGGVCSQFVQIVYGEVLEDLTLGNSLARIQGNQFMVSNTILALTTDLSPSLLNNVVSDRFSSCTVQSETTSSIMNASLDVMSFPSADQDLSGASLQWILCCIPFLSPARSIIQPDILNSCRNFVSVCIRIKFDDSHISQTTSKSVHSESFVCIQTVVALVQKYCFAACGEVWRVVCQGLEAHVLLAFGLNTSSCDFLAIEGMVSSIMHDLGSLNIECSIGIDSDTAHVITYGPEKRPTFFIQSPSISNSQALAVSCPWRHLKTGCSELFPTIQHLLLCPSEFDDPKIFKFSVVTAEKLRPVAEPFIFFERHEASSTFQHHLDKIRHDPHQGVLAICGCFGSGKSHLLNAMELSAGSNGFKSIRLCPDTRNCPPLSPFFKILGQLLEIDPQSTPRDQKLQKCRSFVRSQMLTDDRDVALLGVVLDFTLENDLLEGLTVAAIHKELQSVIARAFYVLQSGPHPFILFIENMYLLDSSSWDLLTELATKKINIVCEALDPYDTDVFALEMKAFLRNKGISKLRLDSVSPEVFQAFLCQKFKCEFVKPEVVSYLRSQSGGRNLFANEWANYMMKNRTISVVDNVLVFSGEYCLSINPVVPSSVRMLVETDFFRLDETQQLFIKIAAILGRSFTLEDVCFLSRKQSSKSFAQTKHSTVQEAQVTFELCSRLCELGILRQDAESQELFTVTYVAPTLLTAAGNASNAVLNTQKAAGLDCDSVLFWCFESHMVQNIVLGLVPDDERKVISLKIASQCQYTSKTLTAKSQESADSSFKIARHLFEGGNFLDSRAVILNLSPLSIHNFLRKNTFLCFPPPTSFEVNEEAYIASRMFLVPWIREFCRCIESINPYKARFSSSNLPTSSSRSSSPSKNTGNIQVKHVIRVARYRIHFSPLQAIENTLKSELSTVSLRSPATKLSRLTDPPKRLARFGGIHSSIFNSKVKPSNILLFFRSNSSAHETTTIEWCIYMGRGRKGMEIANFTAPS